MPRAILTPRINNNDDSVRLIHLAVDVGAEVRAGALVAEVETDKANFTVESEEAGFVLQICYQTGQEVPVGSVLMWLGDNAGEPVGSMIAGCNGATGQSSADGVESVKPGTAGVSLKAHLLLRQYGLDSGLIERSADRLTAQDVERYIRAKGLQQSATAATAEGVADGAPPVAGKAQELSPRERGMLRTVLWHRDSAVPGYLEIPYETRAWAEYAASFQKTNKLMFDPLLSLLAFRLTRIALEYPLVNSTISGNSRYLYEHVNLGFTVQAGATLYMVVVQQAETLTEKEFIDKLLALQIAAMKKSLRTEEISGTTVAFTSMARWSVARHMPILPPYCSFILAHVGPAADGTSHLGATYDHRVLTGFDVAQVLRELSRPPEAAATESAPLFT